MKFDMKQKAATILIVDDDEIDVEALRRALRRAKVENPTEVAHDGLAALECLRGSDESPPLRKPYVILLDINMPRMDGFEFLSVIRNDESLRDSVVFMFSTSADPRDIERAYKEHSASGYIVKQNAGRGFQGLVGMIDRYCSVVHLPHDN